MVFSKYFRRQLRSVRDLHPDFTNCSCWLLTMRIGDAAKVPECARKYMACIMGMRIDWAEAAAARRRKAAGTNAIFSREGANASYS